MIFENYAKLSDTSVCTNMCISSVTGFVLILPPSIEICYTIRICTNIDTKTEQYVPASISNVHTYYFILSYILSLDNKACVR